MIQTVLGAIPAAELGVTLPHEHFYCNSAQSNLVEDPDPRSRQPVSLELREWLEYNWHRNRDNLVLDDPVTAREEAERYRRAGGRSVIDVTSIGIARNPRGLVRLARETGLHIVMGCGYYVAATHPPALAKMTEAAITAEIVRDFREGVDGVKAGVIGEIGCSWPLTDVEEKSLCAAGVAQKILGAALYIHPGKHPGAPPQILQIVRETGADLKRVIICHIERTIPDVPRILDVLRSGCTVEYDLFGVETTGTYYRPLGIDMPTDAQRLNQIRQLIDAGFGKQVLMSHDICFKHWLHQYGGHGYDHILTNTIPWMRRRGFSEAEISMLTAENPLRLIDQAAVRTRSTCRSQSSAG